VAEPRCEGFNDRWPPGPWPGWPPEPSRAVSTFESAWPP